MKLFWLIIVLFSVAAVTVAWMQISPAGSGSAEQIAQAAPLAALERAMPRQPEPNGEAEPPEDGGDGSTAVDEIRDEPPARDRASDVNEIDGQDDLLTGDDLERRLVEDLLNDHDEASPDPPLAVTRSPGAGDHEHAEAAAQAENPWVEAEAEEAASRLVHSVLERDDGTIVLDEMFEIKGDGTKDHPYEVTWDLLMSAAETFQPRIGMNDIPERIQMLDGKHVRISGHLLFPMATFQAKEVLVMLNMWDGCCLGTMPSPYDAIEVQLGAPVNAAGREFMNYGSIEGKLSVDPYLINDWLIGLYVIEEGTLKMGM